MSVFKLNINLSKMKGAKIVKNDKTGDSWLNLNSVGSFISDKTGHAFLDLTLLTKDKGEVDNYGNNGMIVQEVTKEEREAGVQGTIIGNSKTPGQKAPVAEKKKTTPAASAVEDISDDDLPF